MADKKQYIGKEDWVFIVSLISTELAKYVKAVEGKELTDNNLTDELKAKLDGIEDGATKTIIDAVLKDDSENPVQNKIVKAALDLLAPILSPEFTGTPTAPTAVSGTNTTQIATTAFVKTAVDDAMGKMAGIDFDGPYASYEELVSTVTEPRTSVIYLVKNSGSSPNANDEYFWNKKTNSFEKFGSTEIDLSKYLKIEDITELPQSEVKAAWDAVFGE